MKLNMKQYKIKIVFISVFFSLLGCFDGNQKKVELEEEKDNEYYNLVYSVAFGNPNYICNSCYDKKEFDYIKENIKNDKNELMDEELGVYFSVNKFDYDNGFLWRELKEESDLVISHTVVFVENRKNNFKYAFPLDDDYYYWMLYSSEYNFNEKQRNLFRDKLVFENQLNFIISELGLNTTEKRNELNQFITSLFKCLERVELSLKTIPRLEKSVKKELELIGVDKESICYKNFKKNYSKIIKEIEMKDSNIRYFTSFGSESSFWRIEIITTENENLKIKSLLSNAECFTYLRV